MSNHRWYVLHAYSGYEKKVADSIVEQANKLGISEHIEDVSVPTQNIVEVKRGVRVNSERKIFPGYILINMSESKEVYHLVENMTGVISFVGANGEPQPLRKNEITRILGEVEGREGHERVIAPYRVGDAVKVTDGPFKDFSGYVNEDSEEKQNV